MLDINFLENKPNFELITLEKSGVLFDEWDIDNNLYIIKSWSLSVQKYTTIDKTELKQLAVLKKWDIFWEWALKLSEPKQVKIISLDKVILLKIDAKHWMQEFIKNFPSQWIELLSSIIDITNKRLLESNFLVTSNYSMSKTISEIEIYDNKNLFKILYEFNKILWSEYILYLEKNPVIDNYMVVKYDSRYNGKMQNNIVDLQDNKLHIKDLVEDGIELEKYNHIEELKNKNEIIWYLIIWEKNNNFNEGQKKVISSITTLIAGVIKQKQIYEEEKNKNFIKE